MNTAQKLTARLAHNYVGIQHPSGWDELIDDLHEALLLTDPDYKVVQTKEKVGGLRFYIEYPISERGKELIREAETKSFEVCQACGKPGKLVKHGWWATLCSEHDYSDNDRGYEPHTPRSWQRADIQKGNA